MNYYKYLLVSKTGETRVLSSISDIADKYIEINNKRNVGFFKNQDSQSKVLFFNSRFKSNDELKKAIINTINYGRRDADKIAINKYDRVYMTASSQFSRGYGFAKNIYSKEEYINDGKREDRRDSIVPIIYSDEIVSEARKSDSDIDKFYITDLFMDDIKPGIDSRKGKILRVILARFSNPRDEFEEKLGNNVKDIISNWIFENYKRDNNRREVDYGNELRYMPLDQILNSFYYNYLPDENSSLWTNIVAYIVLQDRLRYSFEIDQIEYNPGNTVNAREVSLRSMQSKGDILDEKNPLQKQIREAALNKWIEKSKFANAKSKISREEQIQADINSKYNMPQEDGEELFMTLEDYLQQNDYYTYLTELEDSERTSR